MATRGTRSEKVKRIFHQFDANKDGGLNFAEMAAFVVAVNPRENFSDHQLSAIYKEVLRMYADYINGDIGLTCEGLLFSYDDGAGDVDRDFEALGLGLELEAGGDRSQFEPPNKLCTAAWSASPNHGIVFDETWRIVDDLEVRLNAKQLKEITDNKRVEFGHDYYADFMSQLGGLRTREDSARSIEEAFDGHMAIGRALYEHQMYKQGLVSFNKACELQPVDVRPHLRAGNCFYALGKYEQAQDEFQLALEAAETGGSQWAYLLPQIHVNLGTALHAQGMVSSAYQHYTEAAILYPSSNKVLKLLVSALFGVGKNRLRALEETIFLKPDYADAHCYRASALYALNDGEKAIVEFQKAVDLSPGHVDALYNLGGLYMDIGKYESASEMYTRVLTLKPNHWQAQLNKAVSLLGVGDSEETRKAIKEALKVTDRVEVGFTDVSELLCVCWFDVGARIQTPTLSPDTRYDAYLVYTTGGSGQQQRLELKIGELFTHPGGSDDEVELSVQEMDSFIWKKGLIVQGIEVRPTPVALPVDIVVDDSSKPSEGKSVRFNTESSSGVNNSNRKLPTKYRSLSPDQAKHAGRMSNKSSQPKNPSSGLPTPKFDPTFDYVSVYFDQIKHAERMSNNSLQPENPSSVGKTPKFDPTSKYRSKSPGVKRFLGARV